MARGGGLLSSEEIQLLRRLPAVSNVTHTRITYSDVFKQVCTIRYLAGESPTKIFREAGLPPDLIGYKRIERSVARWKEAAIKSMGGDGNLSDNEIVMRLVNRYKSMVMARQHLDGIADTADGGTSGKDVGAYATPANAGSLNRGAVPFRIAHAGMSSARIATTDTIDARTVGTIIKQQARRIDELERTNAALRKRVASVT